MAMGRSNRGRQRDLWIAGDALPRTPGHPFYEKLNAVLDEHGFDAFVERECAAYYAEKMGRPSLAPAVYFKMLFIGFFEGLDSERGIAWRVADSMALRDFLGYALTDGTPEHSTLSRTRRLMALETHQAVFRWVLGVLTDAKLLRGHTPRDPRPPRPDPPPRTAIRHQNPKPILSLLRAHIPTSSVLSARNLDFYHGLLGAPSRRIRNPRKGIVRELFWARSSANLGCLRSL